MNDFKLVTIDPEVHGPALHAIFGHENSCRYLVDKAFEHVEGTITQLALWAKEGPDDQKAILDAESGEVLGRVTIFPRERGIGKSAS